MRRERWRSKLGPYVLALGGIEPRKGSIDLLEAFAYLRTDSPDLRLVFAGGETFFDYRDYRRQGSSAGPPTSAIDHEVLGMIPDEPELPSLVAQASVLAMASIPAKGSAWPHSRAWPQACRW